MSTSNHNVEFPSSPPVFGPGVWLSMHVLAIDSVNDIAIDFFMEWVRKMVYRLPCSNCVKHATSYVSYHPMEPYRKYVDLNGVRNGMFFWSWLFHNDVNKRLGKPIISYEDAYKLYLPKYNQDNVDEISDESSVCVLGSR